MKGTWMSELFVVEKQSKKKKKLKLNVYVVIDVAGWRLFGYFPST